MAVLCYCSWPNPTGLFHLHLVGKLQASTAHISIRAYAMWLNKIYTLTFRFKVFLFFIFVFQLNCRLYRFLNRSHYNSNRSVNTYSHKQINKVLEFCCCCRSMSIASSGYRTKSLLMFWLKSNKHRHIRLVRKTTLHFILSRFIYSVG